MPSNKPSGQATEFIHRELTRLLYQQSRFALFATALIAPVLAFLLWQPGNETVIAGWLTAIMALTAWRVFLLRRYRRRPPGGDDSRSWERRYLTGVFLAGCLWGSSSFILLQQNSSIEHWFILLFILTGLCGGSLTTLSASRHGYTLFVLPAMLPPALRDWLVEPMFSHAPGILIPLFIVLTISISRRSHAFMRETLATRLSRDGLLMRLEEDNQELNTLYQVSVEAEHRATQANILFDQIFDTTHVLYALLDTNFNFIRVNRAYADAGGMQPGDFVGRNHFELYPNADNEAIFRRVLTTGETYQARARHFRHPRLGDSYWDWTLQAIDSGGAGGVEALLLTLQNVTEQHNMAKALEKEQMRLRAIMDTALDAIVITDSRGIIEECNPATESIFGYRPEELAGQSINQLMPDHYRRQHDAYMRQYMNTNMPRLLGRVLETQGQRKDGSVFPLEVTVTDSEVDGEHLLIGFMRDISEQKALLEKLEKQNEELRYQSSHDPLTGLMNRRYADDYIATEWARARRNHTEISVLIIDVDFFKHYNDTYGHQAGDACLQRLARIFDDHLQRPSDVVARYGGEEFIAILPSTSGQGACGLAESMRQAVAGAAIPHESSSVADHVTVSIGVSSVIPEQGQRFEDIVHEADEALYQAKNGGRNRVVCRNTPPAAGE